jgi:hypothetical protein
MWGAGRLLRRSLWVYSRLNSRPGDTPVNIQRYAVSANDPISPYSKGRSNPHVNVNQQERAPSAVFGAALLLIGSGRRSLGGVVVALAAGELLYRGLSGHCHL